jgi:ankyrin repeat protein
MDPDPAIALWEAVIAGSINEVQLLVTPANVNSQLSRGLTLLQAAAENNRNEVIPLLIEAGGILDLPDKREWTALHIAVFRGAKKAVAVLIQAGADVNLRDEEGYMALHRAANLDDGAIAQMLIDAGAAVDAQVNLETPLYIALQMRRPAVVEVLIQAGADPNLLNHPGWNPFHTAAAGGNRGVVEALLPKCSQLLESKTESGSTALCLAAQSGHCSVVASLLDAGAQIDPKSGAWTALHEASTKGHVEVVRLLLGKKADSELKLDDGRTALHLAAAYNRESVANVLVSHNLELLKATDNLDRTPLHMAVIFCHQPMLEVLLKMGADFNTRDIYCRSPVEYAFNNATLWDIFVRHCPNIQATPSKPDVIKHLENSIQQMRLLLAPQGQRSNHQIYDVLGRLYLLLGQVERAKEMFSQVKVHRRKCNQISCSFCPNAEAIKRERFVCRTCPDVDACGSCYLAYERCPLDPSRGHDFIQVPDPSCEAPVQVVTRRSKL